MRKILMSAAILLLTTAPLLADECGVLCEVSWWKTATQEEINTAIEAADPNSWGQIGVPLLHFVAALGTPENINTLVQAGAELNVQDKYGRTALHSTALEGTPENIDALIKAGADPNPWNEFRQTSLHLAVHEGTLDNINALLKGGADPNARDVGERLLCILQQSSARLRA